MFGRLTRVLARRLPGTAVESPPFPSIQICMIRVQAHMRTRQARECPLLGGTTVIEMEVLQA